ncbi:unnamed protein product [Pedinophyceae sp. YPF-701]|nr:unnamed protein product [Pedinophyceae sp. YPF-701]
MATCCQRDAEDAARARAIVAQFNQWEAELQGQRHRQQAVVPPPRVGPDQDADVHDEDSDFGSDTDPNMAHEAARLRDARMQELRTAAARGAAQPAAAVELATLPESDALTVLKDTPLAVVHVTDRPQSAQCQELDEVLAGFARAQADLGPDELPRAQLARFLRLPISRGSPLALRLCSGLVPAVACLRGGTVVGCTPIEAFGPEVDEDAVGSFLLACRVLPAGTAPKRAHPQTPAARRTSEGGSGGGGGA